MIGLGHEYVVGIFNIYAYSRWGLEDILLSVKAGGWVLGDLIPSTAGALESLTTTGLEAGDSSVGILRGSEVFGGAAGGPSSP